METVETLGEHQVELLLYENITATVKLTVTPAA